MCGIVGYVGDEECTTLLVDGLRKLEYRGYDSAGVAVLGKDGLSVVRSKGKLANLEKKLLEQLPRGMTGIGHTRWATHGKPSDENAHPHKYGGVAVVHNGIIENHLELNYRAGNRLQRSVRRIDWTPTMAEKNGHKHFMHKEIHEQARALTDTIRGRASVEEGDVYLDGCHLDAKMVQRLGKVQIVACGTSWHASLTGKLMIETLAKIPVEVDLASEFRYRDPLVDSRTLCVAVSQSGETADTLGSFREAKARGARGLAICNVVGSAIARESDDVLYTHAGPEIGVASTKAFTTQLAAFFLLAIRLGRLRGTLDAPSARNHLEALRELPLLVDRTLKY